MAKARKVREGDRVNVDMLYHKGPGTVVRKYRKPSWPTSYDVLLDDGRTVKDLCRPAFRLLPSHMSSH